MINVFEANRRTFCNTFLDNIVELQILRACEEGKYELSIDLSEYDLKTRNLIVDALKEKGFRVTDESEITLEPVYGVYLIEWYDNVVGEVKEKNNANLWEL